MKASDVSLILTTTQGLFSETEVPQLYVEIQEHRNQLENELGRSVSFEDAVYSWMENIYSPIMNEILDDVRIRLASQDRKISEIYFEIYEIAQKNGFRNIPLAIQAYARQNSSSIVHMLESLLHLGKRNIASIA